MMKVGWIGYIIAFQIKVFRFGLGDYDKETFLLVFPESLGVKRL